MSWLRDFLQGKPARKTGLADELALAKVRNQLAADHLLAMLKKDPIAINIANVAAEVSQ